MLEGEVHSEWNEGKKAAVLSPEQNNICTNGFLPRNKELDDVRYLARSILTATLG